MLPKITGVEPIEIWVKDLINQKYYFPEMLQLRGKEIAFILALPDDYIAPSTRQTFGSANPLCYKNAYLIFVNNGEQQINRLPMGDLAAVFTNAPAPSLPCPEPLTINRKIDWPKSFIELSDVTGLDTNESFVFYAFYNDHKEKNKPVTKPIKVENIDIQIPQNIMGKFYFPDNERLRGKKILKIEILDNTTLGKTPNGFTPYGSVFTTLVIDGKEKVNAIHWNLIKRNMMFYNQIWLDSVKVDFPKSYVTLGQVNALVPNAAANFQIYYTD